MSPRSPWSGSSPTHNTPHIDYTSHTQYSHTHTAHYNAMLTAKTRMITSHLTRNAQIQYCKEVERSGTKAQHSVWQPIASKTTRNSRMLLYIRDRESNVSCSTQHSLSTVARAGIKYSIRKGGTEGTTSLQLWSCVFPSGLYSNWTPNQSQTFTWQMAKVPGDAAVKNNINGVLWDWFRYTDCIVGPDLCLCL